MKIRNIKEWGYINKKNASIFYLFKTQARISPGLRISLPKGGVVLSFPRSSFRCVFYMSSWINVNPARRLPKWFKMTSKWVQNQPKPFKIIKQIFNIGNNPTQIKQNVILDGFWGSWSARLVPGRSSPKAPNKSILFGRKWQPDAWLWEPFWSQNLSKNNAQIDTKIDAENDATII